MILIGDASTGLLDGVAHLIFDSWELISTVSNRLKAGLLPPLLFLIPISLILFSSVRELVGNALFWLSFAAFALVGAFLFLPEDPIPGQSRKKNKLGFFSLFIVLLLIQLFSRWYSAIGVLTLGYAGLPAGVGMRGLYYLLFQSRWDYCPKCERYAWLLKRRGKWYCNVKGHVIESSSQERAD